MFSKNQIDALFGFKDKDLVHMANAVGDCVEAKKDIFIDFGEGAEEIDDVLYDDYNKKATFFYKFGADRRSITLWEADNPTFHFNSTLGFYKMNPIRQKGCFGREFLKEVSLELKKFGSQAKIRIGDETQLHLEHARKMKLD